MYYVYLLETIGAPKKRYIGFTEDLRSRLRNHNSRKNISPGKFRPWSSRMYLGFSDKRWALQFELYLKSGSGHAFLNKRL